MCIVSCTSTHQLLEKRFHSSNGIAKKYLKTEAPPAIVYIDVEKQRKLPNVHGNVSTSETCFQCAVLPMRSTVLSKVLFVSKMLFLIRMQKL